MRILFALPGLHRVERGAEIAFLAVASELARGGDEVTLIGSGPPLADRPYRYLRAPAIARERFERFPSLPFLRNDTAWEDASFVPGLLRCYKPQDYDVTVTCSFPFTQFVLRRPTPGGRPPHVFVTQNGDWPASATNSEYRLFGCDGLVCINPDFVERNRDAYRTTLIPNGVDNRRFTPGPPEREAFGLDPSRPLILMVSALIDSKNVAEGIRAVAAIDHACLAVAGDGPLRDELQALADRLMPGRYRQLRVEGARMPALYRSADVFLHLSRNESFGNVYVEASACGVPVVGYDLPRTRWILEDTAYYAADESTPMLADTIRAAMKIGDEGRPARVERARQFAWPAIAAQYRDFFGEVIAASRRDAPAPTRPQGSALS